MNGLSLFAGVEGIGLGLSKYVRTVCYVENEPYCIGVLRSRISEGRIDDAPIWDDIRTFSGIPYRGVVDIVFGGFPCQDISTAGKRKGIKEDTRSGLWSEMLRVIGEVRPSFILVENVSALAGFFDCSPRPSPPEVGVTPEGSKIRKGRGWSPDIASRIGEVFRMEVEQYQGIAKVNGDLTKAGYNARWIPLRASDVGANHERERMFIVAYANRDHEPTMPINGSKGQRKLGEYAADPNSTECGWRTSCGRESEIVGGNQDVAYPRHGDDTRRINNGKGSPEHREDTGTFIRECGSCGDVSDTKSPECQLTKDSRPRRDGPADGSGDVPDTNSSGCKEQCGEEPVREEYPASECSGWWKTEPDVGRVAHGIPFRVDQLKCLGNACVPLQAKTAFEILMNMMSENPSKRTNDGGK